MAPIVGIIATGDGVQEVTILNAREDCAAAASLYTALIPALDYLNSAIKAHRRTDELSIPAVGLRAEGCA
jgi:hypothetical protein